MNAPESIARFAPDPHGLDFDALRRAGIATLQALCGDRWTDYNLHDPGVTILEQLCYAITELGYRSDFAPEDYLVGPTGEIDYRRHALHPADEILPSQVLTVDDYRKLFYDSIPELEDVWLSCEPDASAGAGGARGLYRVLVKLSETLTGELSGEAQAAMEADVRKRIFEVFNAHRNLGEDLAGVRVVPAQAVYLSGDVQIHSERDPASIFAEIYFRCAQAVLSGFQVERYVKAFAAGVPLDILFSGPRTVHGFIASTGAQAPGSPIAISKLVGLVQEVEGVAHVQRLALCDAHGHPIGTDMAADAVLRLRFPGDAQSAFLRLHFASSAVGTDTTPAAHAVEQRREDKARVVLDDARVALAKARFEFDTLRNTPQSVVGIVPAPQGETRELSDYFSIQHQFPAIYGINHFGVPPSAPLAHKVSAKQLKAYLYLAEQLMANYLENLQSVGRMFSVDDLHQTYFSQLIGDDALPDIESLYVEAPEDVRKALTHIVSRKDRAEDRRSRLLDVLLAMYGETFSQKSLRRFDDYQDKHATHWLVNNKLEFLRHIATLSRDRATAFDVGVPERRLDGRPNVAGVHAKIAILLGLPAEPSEHPLSETLLQWRLRLRADNVATADDYERAAARLVVLAGRGAPGAEPSKGESRQEDLLPVGLLVHGVRLENYVLEQHGEEVHVHFRTHDERLGDVRLAKFKRAGAVTHADRYVQTLRSFLCKLNVQSEGFYLVEHVLLRPRYRNAEAAAAAERGQVPDVAFFDARVSIVFPAWTARFSDPDFRNLAQETVCRNLPAHLLPEFHWMDFVTMRDFEHRYDLWRTRLREDITRTDSRRLDATSASLASLLMRQRHERHERRDQSLTLWV
ncbi:hypothetical protein [Pandoraea sp. PE-S2T-3]|uniref:hypothetical protein n=1 Tax=Pandoraea sp. PE-S2T-3 TaxID=1986993 RepID=UPI000B3FD747|nr:hypothetical protein [Pandoraea sp. PE-S2T-3]